MAETRVKALKDFAGHKGGDVFSVNSEVAQQWAQGGFVEPIGAKPKAPYQKPKLSGPFNAGPDETKTGGEPAGDGDK